MTIARELAEFLTRASVTVTPQAARAATTSAGLAWRPSRASAALMARLLLVWCWPIPAPCSRGPATGSVSAPFPVTDQG